LWTKVLDGDVKAMARMEKYCRGDTNLTEKLYIKLRPYILNHPHMGLVKSECGACGSNATQSRGYRRTKMFKIQRLQCQSCGSWFDGTRSKV
jgi:transposase-like protein